MSAFVVAPARSSSFIEDIDFNLATSKVRVQFMSGAVHYYSVTLDAIQELLNPCISFGFWFNKNCK
jgi:hypothetical protein